MRTVKLFLAIIAVTLVGTMSYANSTFSKAVITERSEAFNLKAQLEADETMEVVISNDENEVIISDIIEGSTTVNKTYDFNEAHYGEYQVEIFVNGELIRTTVVGKEVTFEEVFKLEVH